MVFPVTALRRVLLAGLCAFVCNVAVAQAVAPDDAARAAVMAGDLTRARDLLLAWQPATSEDADEQLWLLAIVYRESGEDERALEVLQTLVARRPDRGRVRLELADTLARLGQAERAAYHYELARGGELTAEENLRATAAMQTTAQPSPWSGTFGVALVPSSNPTRLTQEETLDLGFGEATLSDASRADPATGLNLSGRLAYGHEISNNILAQFGISASGDFYEDHTKNDITVLADAGLILQTGPRAQWRATLGFQNQFVGGERYAYGPNIAAGLLLATGQQGRLGANISLTDLTYPEGPGADGLRSAARLSYDHALSPQLTVQGHLVYERVDAKSAEIAATTQGGGLRLSYAVEGGLIVDAGLDRRLTVRDGPHGLFGVVQEDTRDTITLGVRHAQTSFYGFAPYAQIVGEVKQSNLPVYSYDALDLTLGFTRRF